MGRLTKVQRPSGRVEPGERRKVRALVPRLLGWFRQNARDLPWRRTRDPYAIWVSEIMLQQTQVKMVVPYWERWMRALPTARALARARRDRVLKLWEGLGYYTRARNLHRAARLLVSKHGGRFPRTFDGVLALPGVGRYTAGAICSIAFNQPAPVLDGNVIRVLARLFGIRAPVRKAPTTARLWRLAGALVRAADEPEAPTQTPRRAPGPRANCSHLNQSLMELGAVICTPRQPRCAVCPVRTQCAARRDGLTEVLPNLGPRPASTGRRGVAFVVERHGRFLVRRRPAGVVNAHFWEFPAAEGDGAEPAQAARHVLGVEPVALEPLVTIKHSITRHRIALEAFAVRLDGRPRLRPPGRWVTRAGLERLPFTASHRKILAHLTGHAGKFPSVGRGRFGMQGA